MRPSIKIIQILLIICCLKLVDSQTVPTPPGYDFPLIPDQDQSIPRFCGLVKGAQNFTCHIQDYAEDCAVRAIPVIVIIGIALIVCILTILIACCVPCCPPKCLNSAAHSSSLLKLATLLLPFILFAAGIILVFIFYFTSQPDFDNLQNQTHTALDQYHFLANETIDYLRDPNFTQYNPGFDTARLIREINQTSKDVDEYVDYVDQFFDAAYIARTVLAWTMLGVGVFIALFGLLCLLLNSKILFYIYLFLTIILVAASVGSLAAIEVTRQIVTDTCAEVQYQNGMFVLIQKEYSSQVDTLLVQADRVIRNVTDVGCSIVAGLSTQPCCTSLLTPACNVDTLPTFLDKTVIDTPGGTLQTYRLYNCSIHCTGSTTQPASRQLVALVYFLDRTIALKELAVETANYPTSPEFLNAVYDSTCFSNKYFIELYTAAACFLVGAFLLTIICTVFIDYRKEKNPK